MYGLQWTAASMTSDCSSLQHHDLSSPLSLFSHSVSGILSLTILSIVSGNVGQNVNKCLPVVLPCQAPSYQ